MLILNADEVRRSLPMKQVVEAMKRAFAALSSDQAVVPLRTRVPVEEQEGVSLLMPAYVRDPLGDSLGVKIVSVFPRNSEKGMPIIYAAVIMLNTETGQPLAVLEGSSLTAIRTGAASGAAIDLLSRPDSKVAAVFGAGVQGRTQLEAACTVRSIQTVWVYDRNASAVDSFIKEMVGKENIPDAIRAAKNPKQAVENADIICAATTTLTPLFSDSNVKLGAHISAVGSYTPEMQEIPAETILRSLVTVDSRSAALAETGDLITPMKQGLFDEKIIHAELGEIVTGKRIGRTSEEQITLFKSVGVAVQDAVAGSLALANAVKMNLGTKVRWD